MQLIPTTIVTGFLGSGKTTLLKRILHEAHGQKIAVIENEFGEESIDSEILIADGNEQIIQMGNGCLCCSIRDDLRATLSTLAEKKRAGVLHFDRVMIETTGIADPGPVIQTFFMDDEVAGLYLLDSVVTLVDAKHANQQLDTRIEAQRQIGFADQIFISKADLVSPTELSALQQRMSRMNPRAKQKVITFGEISLSDVLDVRGFNLSAQLDLSPEPHTEHSACGCHHEHHTIKHEQACAQAQHSHCTHEHKHDENCQHHVKDDDVKSFVFSATRPFDPAKLEEFLAAIVNIYGPKMYRYKGVLDMQGTQHKVIFQGVHQLMGSDLGPQWKVDEPRISKMVFIGVDLPKDILEQGMRQCLV